jgi:hypothetical protein
MPSGKKSSKTSFVDRAKKFGEKLLTRKNLAIAAPLIGAAAAFASKRVRTTVGDAVKSTGETVGAAGASKPAAAAEPAAATTSGAASTAAAKSTAPAKSASSAKRSTKTKASVGDAKADKAKKPAAKRAPRKAKTAGGASGGEGASGA